MINSLTSSQWIIEELADATPKARLFCFCNAGGNPRIFWAWREKLPKEVSLCLIQLPGRHERKSEALMINYEAICFGISHQLVHYLDLPFAFFCFSGGAFFGLDIAKQLQSMDLPTPFHVIINAMAPFKYSVARGSKFVSELRGLSGIQTLEMFEKISGHETFVMKKNEVELEESGSILKADLLAIADRKEEESLCISSPISVIRNTEDVFSAEKMDAWQGFTTTDFQRIDVPGGHFSVVTKPAQYIDIVNQILLTFLNR